MHFIDAWTELVPRELFRLAVPIALLMLCMFLPGRRIARAVAVVVGLAVLWLREAGPLWPNGVAWAVLWGLVAWRAGKPRPTRQGPAPQRPGGIESGAVGLMLGLALLALLVAAVARQDLSPAESRAASYGLLLLCLGLLHLMLRRDSMRAVMAFATLGLGLQVLERAARNVSVSMETMPAGVVLLATAIAVALAARVAWVRQVDAGSAWVGDAHDLHD